MSKHESILVGYQHKGISKLLSNQICTFETVGGEGAKLSDFRPVDASGDPISGEITVQFYNEYGKFIEDMTWCLGEDVDEGMPDGWYDGDSNERKDQLDLGQGFKVYTNTEGANMIYAGEVDVGEIAIPIPKLLSSMGNIRPCAIPLNSIKPVTEDDEPISGEVTLQYYNEYGKFVEDITWCLGEDVDEGMPDGWYDGDGVQRLGNLEAGEGFCIYTNYEGAYLKFPAIGAEE